jgi:hypothetical protein
MFYFVNQGHKKVVGKYISTVCIYSHIRFDEEWVILIVPLPQYVISKMY